MHYVFEHLKHYERRTNLTAGAFLTLLLAVGVAIKAIPKSTN